VHAQASSPKLNRKISTLAQRVMLARRMPSCASLATHKHPQNVLGQTRATQTPSMAMVKAARTYFEGLQRSCDSAYKQHDFSWRKGMSRN
jgi:hypothetical protein